MTQKKKNKANQPHSGVEGAPHAVQAAFGAPEVLIQAPYKATAERYPQAKLEGARAPLSELEPSEEEVQSLLPVNIPGSLVPARGAEKLPAVLDPLRQYFSEISKYPVMSREEEMVVAKHYLEHQDKESAQKLVVSNLRLVVKIAMEYSRAFYNLLDLVQEGNMGLLKAVTKYDPSKGTRFSYYASWWIRAFILKYIIDNFRLVKLGTTQAQKKLFYNLMREKGRMESMGFVPESRQISERLDVREKDVIEMEQRMGRSDMSLDAPSAGLDSKMNIDFFADKSEAQPDIKAEQDDLKKQLFESLGEFVKTLGEKEQRIFSERLYAELPKTLQQIADEYGISRERIRQLEERVVKKLRQFFEDKGFEVKPVKS